jgi:hypothetical protein
MGQSHPWWVGAQKTNGGDLGKAESLLGVNLHVGRAPNEDGGCPGECAVVRRGVTQALGDPLLGGKPHVGRTRWISQSPPLVGRAPKSDGEVFVGEVPWEWGGEPPRAKLETFVGEPNG